MQVAEDGNRQKDGSKISEDIDAGEGDPDGVDGETLAWRTIRDELLPEVSGGLADEGVSENMGERYCAVEVEEDGAQRFEKRDGEYAAVKDDDGGFDKEILEAVKDGGGILGLSEKLGVLTRLH